MKNNLLIKENEMINKNEALKVINVIEQFRLIDTEIQAQQILTILNVYIRQHKREGYSVRELSDDLNTTQASASRNAMSWQKINRSKKLGPDFVQALECSYNRSRKRLSLTTKGTSFLENIFHG